MVHSALSTRNSSIDSLSTAHQERVAEIVESCMIALEHGNEIEADKIVASHPEFAEPLKKCLASLKTLHHAMHADDTEPSHPMLQVGGQLGDFVLGEVLGRGGMGIVYAARQISLNRQVAVKVLLSNIAFQPSQLKRFMLEAKAAAQLQHPHIVPIYAVGEERGIHYHSMQFVDGHSLDKEYPSRWSANNFSGFLDSAIAIADALQHSHDCGIIHRDVKPSNLLIDKSGKVWITDFGLARSTRESGLTQSGELLGTINYMSPEQAAGKPVDQRTDIYSLGVTFYEMLTGKQAFEGNVRLQVSRLIERHEPIRPRKINPKIPQDLETILLKAISKDREDRYLTAADFASDLMAVRDGRPIKARRPSLLQIGLRWIKLHQMLAMVALIGMAATLLAVTIGATQVWLAQKDLEIALSTSERHRALAEQTYWQSRNLLDKWNHDVVAQLAQVPGAEMVRSQMLADTIQYYESFIMHSTNQKGFRDDPALKSDAAMARLQLAATLTQAGELSRAKSNFELAIQTLEDLPSGDLRSEDHFRRIAIAKNDLALVYLAVSQPAEAIDNLTEALKVYESGDQVRQVEKEIAATCVNLARAYRQQGDRPLEVASLERAAKLYRSYLAVDDQNELQTELQSEFATVLDHLALLHAESDLSQALKLSTEAISLHKQCAIQDGSRVPFAQRLGASLHNSAVLIAKHGDLELAKGQFADAIAVKSKLANAYASWPSHWHELATSLSGLGLLECQSENWAAANNCFMRATDSLRRLNQLGNSQPQHRLMLANALCNSAKAVLQMEGNDGSVSKELIAECRENASSAISDTNDESIKRQAREILKDLETVERSATSMDQESRS